MAKAAAGRASGDRRRAPPAPSPGARGPQERPEPRDTRAADARLAVRRVGKAQLEGGPLGSGVHGNRATVLLGDLLDDREPETGAPLLAARDERFEEAMLDLFRNAGPRVGERNDHRALAVAG